MRLSTSAPATAPAAIGSIVTREPNRVINAPPQSAPATPPRLNSVMALLAAAAPSPAPAEHRQRADRGEPGDRAAERHADDGDRHGERTPVARHVLRRQRRGVREGAAKADAGDEAQRRQRRDAVDKSDRERAQPEQG